MLENFRDYKNRIIGLALAVLAVVVSVWFIRADGDVSKTDVLLAAFTIAYTVLTAGLFWSAHSANRPVVTTHMERNQQQIYLAVSNTGNRPAADIRLVFDSPVIVDGRDLREDTGIFKHPIGSLPAGGSILTGFGFGTSLFPGDIHERNLAVHDREQQGLVEHVDDDENDFLRAEDLPSVTLYVEGVATYIDATTGRKYKHNVVIDARYLEGLSWFTSSRDREIPRHLRDTRNEVRSIRRLMEAQFRKSN